MVIRTRTQEGDAFEKISAGTVPAVYAGAWDLGLQKRMWGTEEKKQYKVMFAWQTAKKDSKGNPFYVIKEYTNSLGEKANLRTDLKGLLGRDLTPEECVNFDLESLIGRQCILSIVYSDDGKYANVNSVSTPMDGVRVESFNEVPEWIKKVVDKKLSKSNEDSLQDVKDVFGGDYSPEEEKSFTGDFNDLRDEMRDASYSA